MDKSCEQLKKILDYCLVLNTEVFGIERGKIMCVNLQKLYETKCKNN